MTVGVIMMVHTAFDRVVEVARHWTQSGCPVVIHVDKGVDRANYQSLVDRLAENDLVQFSKRFRCEWGTWGIVAGSQAAGEQLLKAYPQVSHALLSSGSCLPLRPVQEFVDYLAAHPTTDFIESATTADVPWTVGGLDEERFTLYFPFSWRKQRRLFDRFVNMQRRWRIKRRVPKSIVPHMGSQWWCLTRQTLSGILEDQNRAEYDRYFKRVWIPDESYFQTLARQHSREIQSRSLTLSKFDFQGKPHIFYDDHLQLLRRSDCFVARKIWARADRLYQAFLKDMTDIKSAPVRTEPQPTKIDRVFSRAVERRTRGRKGLYMQSRFPISGWDDQPTAAAYTVFDGFNDLFVDFEGWLARQTGLTIHGHLFHPDGAEFATKTQTYHGALPADPLIRDHNPHAYLRNLLWSTRGERQVFQYGPWDNQAVSWDMAKDPNASLYVISGAWAIRLFRSNANFSEIRKDAAERQKIQGDHLWAMRSPFAAGTNKIWTMAEFIEQPMERLTTILTELGAMPERGLTEAPKMVDLTGFGKFLQNLKNQGMHPHLMGDFPVDDVPLRPEPRKRKPYLVK